MDLSVVIIVNSSLLVWLFPRRSACHQPLWFHLCFGDQRAPSEATHKSSFYFLCFLAVPGSCAGAMGAASRPAGISGD